MTTRGGWRTWAARVLALAVLLGEASACGAEALRPLTLAATGKQRPGCGLI